ncbi:hypothetical protein [Bartonella sp. LJL80]
MAQRAKNNLSPQCRSAKRDNAADADDIEQYITRIKRDLAHLTALVGDDGTDQPSDTDQSQNALLMAQSSIDLFADLIHGDDLSDDGEDAYEAQALNDALDALDDGDRLRILTIAAGGEPLDADQLQNMKAELDKDRLYRTVIGRAVVAKMAELNLLPADIAPQIGLTTAQLQRMIGGHISFTAEKLVRLFAFFASDLPSAFAGIHAATRAATQAAPTVPPMAKHPPAMKKTTGADWPDGDVTSDEETKERNLLH